jgi:ribonuclease P protein subunit RPR2
LRQKRSKQKAVAVSQVDVIIAGALKTAKDDIALAKQQAAIARRICLKFNIRLPYQKRQLFCRGCKTFIVPGINARVRTSKKQKMLLLTCLECSHIYRRPII